MINNLLIYALLAGYGYWNYTQYKLKEIEITKLNNKLVSQKKYFEDKVDKVRFNIKSLMKKKEIEKGIKYDKSKSVSLNTTRIYY